MTFVSRRSARELRLLVTAGALALSCQRSSPSDSIQAKSSAAAANAAPSAVPAVIADAHPPAPEPAASSDAGLDLGPSPHADRRAREHAVLGLFAGGERAESLPELATEPNTPLDHDLRDRLAPVQKGTGRRGVASVGNIQAPESLDNAARVVAGMRASFRACYNRALQTNPVAHGVVRVRAQIAAGGEVTAAKATPSAAFPPLLIPCVEARVRAAQFAPANDAKPSDVSFHVRFEVEE
ncbi:MAG TPA: AgmX/PglI C-terminal domain-containing protein [Polyangiaceae bacterium]